MATTTTQATTIASEVGSIVASLATSAVPVIGVIDDSEKLATEATKLVEQDVTLNNTPEMLANQEAQRITELKAKIEAETAKNDLNLDRQGV